MVDPISSDTPDAPWALAGEGLIAVMRRRRIRAGGRAAPPGPITGGTELPIGLTPVPGPSVLVAMHYTDSPVGPFCELAIARPARIGLRIAFCVTTSVVSAPPARVGGRLGWGFPRELGGLTWVVDGPNRILRWEERGVEVRGAPGRGVLPFLVPLRSLQRRADGPVIVPGWSRAIAHLAVVQVSTDEDDDLAAVAGRHRGLLLHGLRLVLHPARRPAGLLSSLRAPLRAPEPAVCGLPGGGIAAARRGPDPVAPLSRFAGGVPPHPS